MTAPDHQARLAAALAEIADGVCVVKAFVTVDHDGVYEFRWEWYGKLGTHELKFYTTDPEAGHERACRTLRAALGLADRGPSLRVQQIDGEDFAAYCNGCDEERGEPHSWEDCVKRLRADRNAAIDRACELEVKTVSLTDEQMDRSVRRLVAYERSVEALRGLVKRYQVCRTDRHLVRVEASDPVAEWNAALDVLDALGPGPRCGWHLSDKGERLGYCVAGAGHHGPCFLGQSPPDDALDPDGRS
jgi:hypothetical protein